MKPIPDKAEVSIDFPDKAYIGSFGQHAKFEAKAGPDDIALKLVRTEGDRRTAGFHIHYYLLADILDELATSLDEQEPLDEAHRDTLAAAADRFHKAVKRRRKKARKKATNWRYSK